MDSRPAIAVTSGEPAGIGPELCAMLAVRHARAPFDARLVLLGDRDLLEARAERIGLAPRYADYTASTSGPAGAIEVWHRPLAAPATPGHPDPSNAMSVIDALRDACDEIGRAHV